MRLRLTWRGLSGLLNPWFDFHDFECETKKADDIPTVTVAIAGSIVDNAQSLELATRVMENPSVSLHSFYPMPSIMLKFGMLPPLDAPHHLRKHEWAPYREERQRQNRDQMMAESLKAMESEGSGSVMDIIQLHCLVSGIGAHDIGRVSRDSLLLKTRNKGNMCSWQFSLPGENWQRLLFPLTCGMDT
ncbi:hypothetical protein GOBAR_AA22713 [Gossypium barbadense]|uniref:Uncharacterized protein n=1 Tax=Gossypium barbadense TaxID=3634 RepID=A0A2P5X3R2_GOSBA|nr:hypothetical protein GOBAR_AA22713 [Gossypium barbadense]